MEERLARAAQVIAQQESLIRDLEAEVTRLRSGLAQLDTQLLDLATEMAEAI